MTQSCALGDKNREWNQESLQDLAFDFMESRIFLTAAELGLFDLLACQSLSADEICKRTGAHLRGLTILLDALAAMELLVKESGQYRCHASVAPFLTTGSAVSVLPMVLHNADLWLRWSKLTEIVGGRRVQGESDGLSVHSFIAAMNVAATALADWIVSLVNLGSARKLLDVGGGSGTYTLAFLRAAPEMRATLFDRPQVVEIARQSIAATGALQRIDLVPGDFYQDPLPTGHDLAFVSAIIHQNDPEQNVNLFRKVFAALDPGGRIVIRDIVLALDRTAPPFGAIFAVNWLAVTPKGNSYTFEEIRNALHQAGFERVRLIHPDTRMDGLVEAFKP